jgi:hypothetical protein
LIVDQPGYTSQSPQHIHPLTIGRACAGGRCFHMQSPSLI